MPLPSDQHSTHAITATEGRPERVLGRAGRVAAQPGGRRLLRAQDRHQGARAKGRTKQEKREERSGTPVGPCGRSVRSYARNAFLSSSPSLILLHGSSHTHTHTRLSIPFLLFIIQVFDALERAHQCATIQLDFQLPIRFRLKYQCKTTQAAGAKEGKGEGEGEGGAAKQEEAAAPAMEEGAEGEDKGEQLIRFFGWMAVYRRRTMTRVAFVVSPLTHRHPPPPSLSP
jgi:hypothetical protein